MAREERQAKKKKRKERREKKGKNVEASPALVSNVPIAPARSSAHVHTVRFDSTDRGEVAVDVAGSDS